MDAKIFLNPKSDCWGMKHSDAERAKITENYMNWDVRVVEDIPQDEDTHGLLEFVFKYGQNDFRRGNTRSMSVGDVTIINGEAFLCEGIGWTSLGTATV